MMNVLISVVLLAQLGVTNCDSDSSLLSFVIVWKMPSDTMQSARAAEKQCVPLSVNFGIEDNSYDSYRINGYSCTEAVPRVTVPSLILYTRCFSFC